MAATTPRTRRSPEDWTSLARELLPEIQAGRTVSSLRERFGSNTYAFQVALARLGYDLHGEPLRLRPITGSRPETLARRLAERKKKGEPYWLMEAESGLSFSAMRRLMAEHGFVDLTSGRSNGSANGHH